MIYMECLFLNASSFVFCNIGNNKIIGTVPENLPRKLETLWIGALFLDCAFFMEKKNANAYFSFLENNKLSGPISLNLVRAKHLREISLSEYFLYIVKHMPLDSSHFANSIQIYRGK